MKNENSLLRLFSANLLLLFLIPLSACSNGETIVVEHKLVAQDDKVSFGSSAATKTLEFNTDYDEYTATVATQGVSWCETSVENNTLSIYVKDNESTSIRTTIVTIYAGNHRQDITVEQDAYGFIDDKPVKPVRATATSEIDGSDGSEARLAAHLIDGDLSTYHNSKVGAITEWPFYYDFYFEGVNSIDYLRCTPRQDSGNLWGAIGKLEVWVSTEENPELTKVNDYDFEEKQKTASEIEFDTPLVNVTHIQFRINSGYQDRVSCAEVEFFSKVKREEYNYLEVFTEGSCSELKPGITVNDIQAIPDLFYKKIALAIYNKSYDESGYRIQDYRPYQHPSVMVAVNKTSKYSLRDNPTGIAVNDTDKKLIVFAGDLKGQTPTLHIRNFQTNGDIAYNLKEGLNVITPGSTGLLYVYNHTEDQLPLLLTAADLQKAAEKTIRVHIATGDVNGLFDITKHTNDDWAATLEKYATHTEIDVVGNYAHVVWPVQDYKDNNTDITKMCEYFDHIVYDQHEFMGLFHYNKAFNNRSFICVNYSASAAAATDYWTYYNPTGYKNVFCTEEGFLKRMWVLGHEVGHTNQVRPGVRWAGMTEVTNNLYAMYNQSKILGEAERMNNSDGYAAGFANIIDAEAPLTTPANVGSNDHMLKLPPFWQLKLYFIDILGQEHFYHDLFEHYRVTEDLSSSVLGDYYHGLLQLDFVRQVCFTGRMDMTDFFIKWGFLRPIDAVINDYGNKTMKITQEQINEIIAEIKAYGYPEPEIEVHKLTDANYKDYIK